MKSRAESVRSLMSHARQRPHASKLRLRTTPERSAIMRSVRQAGTAPELSVRRLLSSLGVRFRLNVRGLPGSPDLVNLRKRFAIFVHGCFWHRHAGCRRTTTPTRNRVFWLEKFVANKARDRRNLEALQRMGFTVCTIWECEALDPGKLVARLTKSLPGLTRRMAVQQRHVDMVR